jgi:hypothetical protein
MNIFQRLVHAHAYEIVGKDARRQTNDWGDSLMYTHITSRCTVCGKIKYKRVRGDIA